MGFNTAVIICNDQLHDIERSPDAGKVIGDTIAQANAGYRRDGAVRKTGEPAYGAFSIGALPSRHADDGQLILIGQNSIQLVGYCWTGVPLEAIRQVADQLGYTLKKKPERKSRDS